MNNYFLNTTSEIENNNNLRSPQRGAYARIFEHFNINKKTSHAIVVLPTGVGKTGLMAIAPFNISKGKVLIITPQLTIKDTVLGSLNPGDYSNFWSMAKVLKNEDLPVVVEYNKSIKKNILDDANIVILNIQKLQMRLDSSLIKIVDENYFDMIIIDEAHHSTANTWVETLEYFKNAKVIKVTGTPIRADGQKMSGDLVYEYRLSQAMANNYVKSLVNEQFISEELKFTIDNDEETLYSLEEVKKIKDEDWINRSVAYSLDCSKIIVTESIKLLNNHKKISNLPHKIIAVACSIKHAEDIKKLYKNEGINAEVIHSDLGEFNQKKIKKDIENNNIDVIVNVGMLGEGYDHKYLSIAAIFRPYKSELAYAQFIGRILRRIDDKSAKSGDNIGRIISHANLGIESLWEKYKIEINESEIIKSLNEEDYLKYKNDKNEKNEISNISIGKVETKGGEILKDKYFQTENIKKFEEEQRLEEQKIESIMETLNVDKNKATEIVKSTLLEEKVLRPDLLYINTRMEIDENIKEIIVPEIMTELNIEEDTKDIGGCIKIFNKHYKWIGQKSNSPQAKLAIYFNAYLKKEIGKKREDMNTNELKRANELLEKQAEYVKSVLGDFLSN